MSDKLELFILCDCVVSLDKPVYRSIERLYHYASQLPDEDAAMASNPSPILV